MATRMPQKQQPEWDLAASVVLLVALALCVGVTAFVAAKLSLRTVSCADANQHCNDGLISLGLNIAIWGSIAVIGFFVAWGVRRLVTHRFASWVPAVGIAACGVIYVLSYVLVVIGTPAPVLE